MHPSDERWEENIKERKLNRGLKAYKEQAERDMEFPNPVEGFDAIYEVVDGEISLRMDAPLPGLVEQAKKELAEESERIQREEEESRKRKDLLEKLIHCRI